MSRFGELRLVRPDVGRAHRALFRVLGVADPSHYLRHRYLRRALDRFPELTPRRILDAGCGSGDHTVYLARRFPEAEVLGIDVDSELIERNRNGAHTLGIANAQFQVADVLDVPQEEAFDLIVSIDVLEHVPRQSHALACLTSALRSDGLAFYHIPTVRPRPVPFSRWLTKMHEWAEDEHIADERSAEQFAQLVRNTGLRVVEARRTFGYFTGELATSMFALPYENTPVNRAAQVALAPICRLLALADPWGPKQPRYAVALTALKADDDTSHPRP